MPKNTHIAAGYPTIPEPAAGPMSVSKFLALSAAPGPASASVWDSAFVKMRVGRS